MYAIRSYYVAKVDSLGNLSDVSSFDKKINSKLNESTAVFTKDGNTMYFTRNNIVGNKTSKSGENEIVLKIFKATKNEKGKWENIKELPFNSDEFNTAHPALSPDEKYRITSYNVCYTKLLRVYVYDKYNRYMFMKYCNPK